MSKNNSATTNGKKGNPAKRAAKGNGAKKTTQGKKPEPFEYELDTSPTARALMKAFRMTHERLHGAKVKRA